MVPNLMEAGPLEAHNDPYMEIPYVLDIDVQRMNEMEWNVQMLFFFFLGFHYMDVHGAMVQQQQQRWKQGMWVPNSAPPEFVSFVDYSRFLDTAR